LGPELLRWLDRQWSRGAELGAPPGRPEGDGIAVLAPLAAYQVLRGAVAQLGERLNGIQEVRGSIPLGSMAGVKRGRP
jgi:hypothetical protein